MIDALCVVVSSTIHVMNRATVLCLPQSSNESPEAIHHHGVKRCQAKKKKYRSDVTLDGAVLPSSLPCYLTDLGPVFPALSQTIATSNRTVMSFYNRTLVLFMIVTKDKKPQYK